MAILKGIWSRETVSSDVDLSLARRLEQLSSEGHRGSPGEADQGGPARVKTAGLREAAQDTTTVAVADPMPEVADGSPETPSPVERKNGELEEVVIAEATAAADREASSAGKDLEAPVTGKPVAAAPEQPTAAGTATDAQSAEEEIPKGSPTPPPSVSASPVNTSKEVFRMPEWNSKPQQQRQDRPREVAAKPAEAVQERPAAVPTPQGNSQRKLEPLKVAFNWAETIGEDTLTSARQVLADLQAAKQGFETELRERLDSALTEFERHVFSDAVVEKVVGRIEQKSKVAKDNILREVQEHALTMFNAVVGELRSFRDQFSQVIEERTTSLEQTTQQALELKARIEEALPQAEKMLQSLSVTGQDVSARFEAASTAFSEQLRDSHQALAQEIGKEKETLRALAQESKRDEMRLKEEVEKFRRESGAAYDIFGSMADKSLERLNAGVEEATARARGGLENLAAQIEQRILSGGLVEKVTEQVEKAAQGVVERALERIKNAGAEAEATSASLAEASQQVVDRFGRARQEIESRLDGLMGEQQGMLQAAVAGFQRKAAEDLGSVVEQVVTQSSQQLDERLRNLCSDLLASTSKQIDGAARTTLETMHSGLKETLEPTALEMEAELHQPAEPTRQNA